MGKRRVKKVIFITFGSDRTMQNDGCTTRDVGRNTYNVYQGPKGGLEEPPRAPGDPRYPYNTWKNFSV